VSAAEKILQRMRQTKAGWKPGDFAKLYSGFGFNGTEGKRHTKYRHPRYPDLWTMIPRSDPLSKAYADDAVKMIDRLAEREAERQKIESDAKDNESK
jgi:hypothetical protein